MRPWLGIVLAFIFVAICFTPQVQTILTLPDNQRIVVGEASTIQLNLPARIQNKIVMKVMGSSTNVFASQQDFPVTVNQQNNGYEIMALKPGRVDVRLNLFGYIPIKSIQIESVAPKRVVPGGHSIGVLLQSKGIMVVGFAPIVGSDGEKIYPGRDQGLQIGDLIFRMDDQAVSTEVDLAKMIDSNKDKELKLEIKRKGKAIIIQMKPVHCAETDRYRIGLYVRDGVVGVGTLTFWDPETEHYAALGHIIVDADTRQGIDVLKGRVVGASIQTIKPGKPGHPGEKIGIFNDHSIVEGNIVKNSQFGIYGKTAKALQNPLTEYSMEVAYAHQVKEGNAQILTVVNGEDIEAFDIVIEKVYPQRQNGKGMIIKVTDPRLISLTGGIVQGMSGSPIIQNNRIAGAVTHVFLNNPISGYGIFMDNMLSEMPVKIESTEKVSTF
ncbi:MAG: SpoIVB peptidase [Bacillota bacterium]|nr:SpoIVB peptidase [Bacillota bacterium]